MKKLQRFIVQHWMEILLALLIFTALVVVVCALVDTNRKTNKLKQELEYFQRNCENIGDAVDISREDYNYRTVFKCADGRLHVR